MMASQTVRCTPNGGRYARRAGRYVRTNGKDGATKREHADAVLARERTMWSESTAQRARWTVPSGPAEGTETPPEAVGGKAAGLPVPGPAGGFDPRARRSHDGP